MLGATYSIREAVSHENQGYLCWFLESLLSAEGRVLEAFCSYVRQERENACEFKNSLKRSGPVQKRQKASYNGSWDHSHTHTHVSTFLQKSMAFANPCKSQCIPAENEFCLII